MNVVPVGFILFALGVEQAVELVRHFFCDVGGQLLDIAVILQEGAAHVQGQVGAVDHALEQHQKFGNDLFDVVRHEHLAVEQLDFALLAAKVPLDPGEIQNALEVEGIIHVEMHPEQGILKGVEQLVIGVFVFLIRAVLGAFQPQGMGVVDGLFLFGFFLFLGAGGLVGVLGGFFPVQILQIDGHAHVAAVPVQHLPHPVAVQELLFILHDMQDDGGAPLGAAAVPHGEGHAVLAFPQHGGGAILVGKGVDGHLIGGHERGIKAQAEVADDAALVIAGVILQKFLGAGKGHLVDVLFHFLGGHANAVIGEAQFARFLIHRDGDPQILAGVALEHFILGDGVTAVADHFADENVLIGIQPALDDRHDILRVNGNIALGFHGDLPPVEIARASPAEKYGSTGEPGPLYHVPCQNATGN